MKNKLVMKTVDILRKAKEIYISGEYCGMCACIWEVVDENMSEDDFNNFITKNIPLFNHNIASGKFGATGHECGFWWNTFDYKNRLDYFDWLIEQYSKKDEK